MELRETVESKAVVVAVGRIVNYDNYNLKFSTI